jgi:hypothetical protein
MDGTLVMEPTNSADELYGMIQDAGWNVAKDEDVNGQHIVVVVDPDNRMITRTGPTQAWALANAYNFVRRQQHPHLSNVNRGRDLVGLPEGAYGSHRGLQELAHSYMAGAGLPYNPPRTYQSVDPQRASRIAEEYERMPHAPNDPTVAAAYQALANETMAQYNHLTNHGYSFDFYPEADPYPMGPRQAIEDLHNNQHLYVFPTEAGFGTQNETSDHPLLADTGIQWGGKPVTYNDLFRGVHDVFGHAKEGVGFRANGEENAWRQHAAMFTPQARGALTSETRGQNSWVNYGPHGPHNQRANQMDTIYADQKAGLMPPWTHNDGAQDPHLSVLYPSVQDVPGTSSPQNVKIGDVDPNKDYHSGEINRDPIELNSPEDASKLNVGHVQAAAQAINTEWWKSNDPNVWKQAVMNALRTALLSPRKNFNWNMVHQQQLRHLPHDATASDMFRTLEFNRRRWNAARGHDPLGHVRFAKELKVLTRNVQEQFPDHSRDDAEGIALGVIGNIVSEAERALLNSAMSMPGRFDPNTQAWKKSKPTSLGLMSSAYDVAKAKLQLALGTDPKTNESAVQKLQTLGIDPSFDLDNSIKQAALEFSPENREDYATPNKDHVGDPEKYGGKYGAFVYNHLDAIEEAGKHINDLANLAHEDMEQGGTGHLWRNGVLKMGIPGMNSKVASFTWLLLAPTSSELGAMDTHMVRALTGSQATGTHLPGITDDTIGSPLLYYGAERGLKAMRDSMGYQNVPLGQYQWAIWDRLRGTPSDHTPGAVLDTHMTPHHEMDWPKTDTLRWTPEFDPDPYMMDAYDARKRAWTQYMREHGGGALDAHPDPTNPIAHPDFDPDNPTRPRTSSTEDDRSINWFNHGPEDQEEFIERIKPNVHYHTWGYWAPLHYQHEDEEHDERPRDSTHGSYNLSSEGGRVLAGRWLHLGRSLNSLEEFLNEQDDALFGQPGWKQFKSSALNTMAALEWKEADQRPTYRFVFYRGHLEVDKGEHSFRSLLDRLLKQHQKNIGDWDVEDKDVASGDIYPSKDGMNIELQSLADNEVHKQALERVEQWAKGLNLQGQIKPAGGIGKMRQPRIRTTRRPNGRMMNMDKADSGTRS